jgi:predicted PurR-regulated permease PerM
VSKAQTVALVLIATVLIGWVLHIGASILQPMVIALLLANVLQPAVTALERKKIPGPVAVVGLTVILFYSLFQVGILVQESVASFIGAEAVGEQLPSPELPIKSIESPAGGLEGPGATELDPSAEDENDLGSSNPSTSELPEEKDEGDSAVENTTWGQMVMRLSLRIDQWQLASDDVKSALKNALKDFDAQSALTSLIGGGINFTRSLVVILIYMAFIFAEQNIFRRKMLAVAGARREEASAAIDTISRGIQRYLSIKTLVSILTGTVCYSLLVIFKIPYAEVFGLLTVLLNYIPTFGSIVAGLPPTITALAVYESWVPAMAIAVSYAAVNLVLGTILEPRVLGRELNISPLVIIISVVVWGGIWGIVGAFLAVPLTATIQIILASSEKGRPIAILLSGRPPADENSPPGDKKSARLSLPGR